MKIRVIILSFFVAIISGLFIQQSAQGEVVPYNYAGKKLTITLLGDSYSGYLEEYGYYHMLEYEKNQAKKDDSKKENTNRKSVNVASNNKVIGGNNKKIATMDSDGKGVKLQENSSVNEVETRETQKKFEDNNEDNRYGSSWFGIAAAVGMVAISVVIIVIKVYRQKTRLS